MIAGTALYGLSGEVLVNGKPLAATGALNLEVHEFVREAVEGLGNYQCFRGN